MLRGVFDGGGFRKQNGHWQGSVGIVPPVTRHVIVSQILNIVSNSWSRFHYPDEYNTTHYGSYLRFDASQGIDPYYNQGGTSGNGLGGREYSASSGYLPDYPEYDAIKNASKIGFTISANNPNDARIPYLIVPAFIGSGQGYYQGLTSQITVIGENPNVQYDNVEHHFSTVNLGSTDFTIGYYKLNDQNYQPPEDNPFMGGYIVGDKVDIGFISPIADPYEITSFSFKSFFAFAFNAPAMGDSYDPLEIKIEWWYEE